MSDDLEDGGPEDLDEIEFPTPEQKAFRKKIWAVIIVIAVVLSSFGIWYVYFRPWTIGELEDKFVDEYDAPSFDPYLAGTSAMVGGKVASFDSYNNTTLGPLTFIKLEGAKLLQLIDWKEPDFEIGDTIVREIRFEWGKYNNYSGVFSPQVDYPVVRETFNSYIWATSYSQSGGIFLFPRNDVSSDSARIDVYLERTSGAFPLESFNVSLRKGIRGPPGDYWDFKRGYKDGLEIDHLDTLEQHIGAQGSLRFVDANSNGLLDNWDFFQVNLSRPSDDNSVITYYMRINDGIEGYGLLEGECYITMTNRGVFGNTFLPAPESLIVSIAEMRINSETVTPGGVSTELVISSTWGPPFEIQKGSCRLWDGGNGLDCTTLTEGEVASEGNISIDFSDVDQDGYLDSGDSFVISGLTNLAEYSLSIQEDERELSYLEWTTGLGVFSGHLPIVEWEEPQPLDSPTNRIFKLQIGRMYGIPGVLLGYPWDRIVVDILVDGQSVLSYANLTSDFNYTSPSTSITFEDSDSNGYVNSGDFFICNTTVSAEFELKVSYVDYVGYPRHEQILISWPISWQTG